MKTIGWLWLVLLPLAAYSQRTGAGQASKRRFDARPGTLPNARAYPGDAGIDIGYYGLDLHLTHTPNWLKAQATIRLKPTAALTTFYLDFNSGSSGTMGLRVDSVRLNGQSVPYQFTQNKLTLTPAQALSAGQTATLYVYYQGIPNSAANASFVFGRHERTADPAIWSLSEPYGASDWFPCKDTPADKADSSDVRITAAASFVSVSNGTLVSQTPNPDGTHTYSWHNSYPIAPYLISIAMSNYSRYDTPYTSGGTTLPITHYVYPESLPLVKTALDETPKMLAFFSNRFGVYPFGREKYGHAQIGKGNGGMEHQTVSSMEEGAFTIPTIAHELAHQWFGDKITCRDWPNIWLNEGFATYSEALYAEHVLGVEGYQAYMSRLMSQALNATGSVYAKDISSIASIFDNSRSYAKGAAVLHMLRGVLGDTLFNRTLRTYANSPALAYKTATTDDFQAVAEQVSGQKLGYFFQQWIYGEGYPTYSPTLTTGADGTATVRLQQRNTKAASPASFTMPVQITVQGSAGDTTLTVFNDQADQTFTLPAKGKATGVILDARNYILKATTPTTIATITATETLLESAWQVFPNPVTDVFTVQTTFAAPVPTLTYRLTNLMGQTVWQTTRHDMPVGISQQSVSTLGLPTGTYTLTLQTPTAAQSRVVLVR